ncbi:diaminopimelate decarboxylase [archaeon]|nr:diaminopimelate decarboxylase [archaeon]
MNDELWWERPDLRYDDNNLTFGKRSVTELAKEYGTPLYIYNGHRMIANYNRIKGALEKNKELHGLKHDIRVDYAVKALPRVAVLKLLHEGAGCNYLDVVSPAEALAGIQAGYKPENIMFTGTSTSDDDLSYLLKYGVFLDVDSEDELKSLNSLHPEAMDIAVRVNPGIGAGFSPGTITAGAESHGRPIKFGVPSNELPDFCMLANSMGKNVVGLHQHIGSNWKGREVYDFLKTVGITLDNADIIAEQNGSRIRFIDFGGGPGIKYKESDKDFPLDTYAWNIWNEVKRHKVKFDALEVEPGRYIVGDAGMLLLQVNTVEEKNGTLFIGVNGGFNTLIRPMLYGYEDEQGNFHECYHEIVPCKRTGRFETATVAGNLCETGDLFAINRLMEIPRKGDYIAILNAGAYGSAMSSNYNSRPLAGEILLLDNEVQVIRKLQQPEEIVI